MKIHGTCECPVCQAILWSRKVKSGFLKWLGWYKVIVDGKPIQIQHFNPPESDEESYWVGPIPTVVTENGHRPAWGYSRENPYVDETGEIWMCRPSNRSRRPSTSWMLVLDRDGMVTWYTNVHRPTSLYGKAVGRHALIDKPSMLDEELLGLNLPLDVIDQCRRMAAYRAP